MQVNMLEAKNRLSSLIIAAERDEEVVIARNGVPVAKIVNQLYKLIGQYSDEQVAANPLFFMMKDRPKTQITFEATKNGFESHPIIQP